MTHRRTVLIFAAIAMLTACGVGGSPPPPPPSAPSPLLGERMPGIRRPTVSGGQVTADDMTGRIVVVKFFAKYCEPCKRTLPLAQLLHQKRDDVLFIGVSEDERASEAQEIAQLYGLTFPVVHDRSNVLAGKFRVRELPVTFVSDRSGTLRYVIGPAHDEQSLARVLDSLQ